MYTCCDKKAVITPGYVVHIPDEREYQVLRTKQHSVTLILSTLDAKPNQHSFMRLSTPICLLPAPTRETKFSVSEQSGNWFCKLPRPPVFTGWCRRFNLLQTQTWRACQLKAPRIRLSCQKLQQGFEEAKTAVQAAFKGLCVFTIIF